MLRYLEKMSTKALSCRKVLHDYFVEKGGFRGSVTGEIVRVRIEEFTRRVEITFLRSIRGYSSQILSSSCMSIALRLGILGTSSHQMWKLFSCCVHSLFGIRFCSRR